MGFAGARSAAKKRAACYQKEHNLVDGQATDGHKGRSKGNVLGKPLIFL
jgi:hypothetical protein